MKRLFLGLACMLFLSAVGPVPVVSAHSLRFWHRHHDNSAATSADQDAKVKKDKHHNVKSSRSPGGRNAGPGPAGAGAN